MTSPTKRNHISSLRTGQKGQNSFQKEERETFNDDRDKSVGRAAVVVPNSVDKHNEEDDDSGSYNHDDDDGDDDDDDDQDNDDDNEDVKTARTVIDFSHRNFDNIEGRTVEDEKDEPEKFINRDIIFSKQKSDDSSQNLIRITKAARSTQAPSQTGVSGVRATAVSRFGTISGTDKKEISTTELSVKENKAVNKSVYFEITKKKTLVPVDIYPTVFKAVNKNLKQNKANHPIGYQINHSVSPLTGLTRKPVPQTGLLSVVLNDTLDDLNYYSKPSVCPVLQIRQSRQWSENVNCVQQKIPSTSCARASKEYSAKDEPVKCSQNDWNQQLCSYKMTNMLSSLTEATVVCNTTVCGTHPVYVLEFSPTYGILEERAFWKRYFTTEGLETYLKRYAIASSSHGFNFCILACFRKDRLGIIEQLFTFHSLNFHKATDGTIRGFNLNIILLDSVSRPHFYRSLPKTVTTLREIVHYDSYNATVLDFELMQSTAAYTFHNIRALMSGKTDFGYSGGHVNETYGIDVLFGKFKQLGYYTLLQEDSCWFDSWGSLFTDNKYQGSKPQNESEFARRWQEFREMVKHYNVDDFGLSHASCEVLKRYSTTNQFNHPKRVCYAGKPLADYFLDYTESIYDDLKALRKDTRVLTYTHLNTGHEVSGTRIRQIDERLSRYIEKMASMENTLTVVLSDHGPKTTGFSFHTMEGRAEKYDPFLFMVLPEKVARALGLKTVKALVQNQNRLITTLDLHKAFMSLEVPGSRDQGIFGLIPVSRTCADLSMKPLAVCKCEGWEKRFPDGDKRFMWLAEFAVGNINNNIQEQYLRGSREIKGYGNCQRLTGKNVSKIRQRSEGGNFFTTMDVTVSPGNEIFEVQFQHSQNMKERSAFVKMTQRDRVTIYRHFSKCADTTVSLGLCVCDHGNYHKRPTKQKLHKWVTIKTRQDMLELISFSNSFGVETKVKDIHDGCLLLIYRNHRRRSTSFEISNTCNDRTYNVTISVINARQYFLSRRTPFSILVQQRTVSFLLIANRFKKSRRDFRLKVSHLVKYLKRY